MFQHEGKTVKIIGKTRIKTSALLNTHFIDEDALAALDRSQPINRLKFAMTSPFLDFRYGDFTTEYSELTFKGTRVRGIYSKFLGEKFASKFQFAGLCIDCPFRNESYFRINF